MTTRTEAIASALEWAEQADRHAHHGHDDWRDRAHQHALMWTGIAALMPEDGVPSAAEMQELVLLRAARDRTIQQMRDYSTAGSGGVNPRQVVNLLSLTWPDGNYEAAPEADHG